MPYRSLIQKLSPLAASQAVANTVSATDLAFAGGRAFIEAGRMKPGSAFKIRAAGKFSTAGTPTLVLGAYLGGVAGVALAASGATTTASGASNLPWRLEVDVTCRSDGATGTVMVSGVLYLGTSLTAFTPIPIPNTALATVTVDTTAAKEVTIGATWGTASASNTITCEQFLVEDLTTL